MAQAQTNTWSCLKCVQNVTPYFDWWDPVCCWNGGFLRHRAIPSHHPFINGFSINIYKPSFFRYLIPPTAKSPKALKLPNSPNVKLGDVQFGHLSSGKCLHKYCIYGKILPFEWENSLFLWPFSSSQAVSHCQEGKIWFNSAFLLVSSHETSIFPWVSHGYL